MKLGHVHLKVDDLGAAVEFYETVLELEVRERTERYVFMSSTAAHHQLALQEVKGRPRAAPDRPGLYHVAFEVENHDELVAAYKRAREHGMNPRPVDHGISESIYLRDPANNGLEIYRDTREEADRAHWDGKTMLMDLNGGSDND